MAKKVGFQIRQMAGDAVHGPNGEKWAVKQAGTGDVRWFAGRAAARQGAKDWEQEAAQQQAA